MKINFSSLFQVPLQKYKFFFIFGNDDGVFERALFFLQKKLGSPFQIKREEELLTSTGSRISLFANLEEAPSLFLILAVTDKLLKHVDQLQAGIFIFTSEKARAQSKLVTYFTQSSNSLAIAAYASPLLMTEFNFLVSEMVLPPPFKDLLFKTYQNDYRGLVSTLEKIKLFGEFSEEHYDFFLKDFSISEELTPLLHGFLLKNLKKITEAFSLVNHADVIPFLRLLNRSFQTLCELMPFTKSPQTISWQTLTPPVFFKEQPLYEAALSHWNSTDVHHFLEGLLTLEWKVKYSALTLSQVRQSLLDLIQNKELSSYNTSF